MSKKYLLLLCFLIIFSLLFTENVLAAVLVTINNYPSVITEGQTFNVNASVSGASDGTNYLRVDLYKDGTTNYFGETFNGNSWYIGSIGTNFLPLQISNSTGSADIEARIGTPSASFYTGPGNYKLKVRRYTSSGSSYTFSSPVDVQIVSGQQTPTPTPIQTASPSPSPSPVPTIQPTFEPTATPISTPTITSPSPTPLRTSAPQGHSNKNNHEFHLPFGFRCGFERHEFEFKKFHFKYFKVSFHRR